VNRANVKRRPSLDDQRGDPTFVADKKQLKAVLLRRSARARHDLVGG